MDFDGAVSKEGAGARIWVRSPENDPNFFLINCILTVQIMRLNMKL